MRSDTYIENPCPTTVVCAIITYKNIVSYTNHNCYVKFNVYIYYSFHDAYTGCVKPSFNQKCTTGEGCSDGGFKCESSLCKCDNTKYYYEKSGATTGESRRDACR